MDLLRRRIRNKLSQTEVAQLVGTSQLYVSLIETGKCYPSQDFQQRIENIMGSIDWTATRLNAVEIAEPNREIVEQILHFVHSNDPMPREQKIDFLATIIKELKS